MSSARLLACALLLAAAPDGAAEPTKAQCIAANEGAQDLRGAGKLIEARAQLAVCVAESCPGAVRQDCAQRLADVDRALPSLVVVAKDASGNDLGGVRVTVDGKPLADTLNGTAIPMDPGEHRLVLEAAGLPHAEKTLVLHEGEKGRREVVTFAPSPSAAAQTPPATAQASSGGTTDAPDGNQASPATTPDQTPTAGTGDTQRKVGVALGGVGVVGLVVGSILGIVAKSTYDHAKNSECPSPTTCTAQGVSDVSTANGQATAATVGFVAGAALLGAGAYVYLSAPRGGSIAIGPAVGNGGAGIDLRGAW